MKPRVFISSTYYDLKYLRESLEKFMFNMNFEPVLFEANKVTFEHGKPLDVSCFNEVKSCHIMILIIGGRYGSIISEQNSDLEKEIYDSEYISITRKEYETALKDNIPTFIFIDKNVFGEYNTYKINRDFYEEAIDKSAFKFFYVDSINIFKFIDLVSTKALKAFDRIEEIEFYLRDQISGMFHLYLESLKLNNRQDDIFDTVSELKNIVTNMNFMVKEVGKKIIEPERYEEVIAEQFDVILKFFFDKLENTLNTDFPFNIDDDITEKLFSVFVKKIFTQETKAKFQYSTSNTSYDTWEKLMRKEIDSFNHEFDRICPGFSVEKGIRYVVDEYFNMIEPLMISKSQTELFNKKLKNSIKYADLPF